MSPLITTFQYRDGSFNAIKFERKIKGIQIEREEIKLSLFTGVNIIYVGNLKELIKKNFQEIMSNCGKGRLIYKSLLLSSIPAITGGIRN